jgi:hypothetical protein
VVNGNGDLEERVGRLEQARKELEDAFIVMTQLETRMSQNLRQQAEWLAELEPRMRQAEKALAEMTIKNLEMQEKIDFIIDREMRREGGPESQ